MHSTENSLVTTAPFPAADRLLVVDDQEADVATLRSTLQDLGFEITHASTGAQALTCMGAQLPDLVLLDLTLPDMDGFEICKQIQQHAGWSDIPIIFLSRSDDKSLLVRALESGGADYLAQPFDKAELLSRVRTQLMLKTTRDHLKQLAKDKEELMGMISHHLQNRLSGMEMSAQLLLDRVKSKTDPRTSLLAENIRSTTSQMHAFIKALLANATADRGIAIKMEPVHFSQAAGRALARYEDAARTKELVLRAQLPNDGIYIHADPGALDQVFDNLLSNAVKFSPPGREISVRLERVNSHAECRIQDQGPGFTSEDTTRLFHRYARLSARPTGGEPSTGLGLSIAKKLVDAMQGELSCLSEPGRGATFILSFPVKRPARS